MRYHCNDCGCEFYYNTSYTFETVSCPQCKSNYLRSAEGVSTNATEG